MQNAYAKIGVSTRAAAALFAMQHGLAALALDENAPKTDPSLTSVAKTPDGPTGPETTFRFRQQNLGKIRETTTRFIAIEPTRKIEFEAEIGPMRPRCNLTFGRWRAEPG